MDRLQFRAGTVAYRRALQKPSLFPSATIWA
jgi:hypothetical protein